MQRGGRRSKPKEYSFIPAGWTGHHSGSVEAGRGQRIIIIPSVLCQPMRGMHISKPNQLSRTNSRREESLSNKKMADLAAGKALVAEATHKRRGLARVKMLKEIQTIVEEGEGSYVEILTALAAASDRSQ